MSGREACRCGYSAASGGDHPCHFGGYTCRKPAKIRFYDAKPVALAGAQMKLQASDTWACDEHWEAFSESSRRKRETA